MNKNLLILGIILIVAGAAGATYFISQNEGTRLRTYGLEGIAVVGVLLAIGGVMMKPKTTNAMAAAARTKPKTATMEPASAKEPVKKP